MCGIAGVINYPHVDLERLKQSLYHRGPDDQKIFQDNQVALIQTRLAIQDIQNGIQPFHYKNYSIIFNGEIYNHKMLRSYLPHFDFQTHSDTETLLYLFIKYQFKAFDLIDGMFAFCIYDKENNKLILARDRAGKKPLYYCAKPDKFAFASELNALKIIENLTVSQDAIHCYLRTGFVWGAHTAYNEVCELLPGSYLELNLNTLNYKVVSYFNLLNSYQEHAEKRLNFKEGLVELETTLQQSVSDRISASDVEVGVFLSSGIDSNLIAAVASQLKPNIKTFTVKFEGAYDEAPLASIAARKYRTDHVELNVSQNLKNDIETILVRYGEPFMDSSAIPSYYVSKAARQYVKVILSGDGADELFAGYRRYVPAAYGLTTYLKRFSRIIKALPPPKQKQSLYNYLHRLLAMSHKNGLDYYLSSSTDIFEDVLTLPESKITQKLTEFIESVMANPLLNDLNKMLYLDFSALLCCDLLVKMDIASMANSLEVRSPFLSKYMLELAPRLSKQHKINRFKTKFILRKLAEKYLPRELIHLPKRGFEVPLKKWVNHDLYETINDYLQSGCYAENYVSRDFIQNLLAQKLGVSDEKRAKMLWSLYCLEVWHSHEKENNFYR